MKVQTRILLLLLLIAASLIGALVAFQVSERRKFTAIAEARSAERGRMFEDFLVARGDALNVVAEDFSIWDDMVRATVKGDRGWAEKTVTDDTLAAYQINALWIYRSDRTLLFSRNNRYAEDLRNLPVPAEAMSRLLTNERTCHFFLQVPQGWMELRGATIHPSNDHFRETKPEGYLFVGQFWINENIRRMSLFTGYTIELMPDGGAAAAAPSAEQVGQITFSRAVPGWDGQPAGRFLVRNDSPIIRELNRSSHRLFLCLLAFAGAFVLVLSLSLLRWVRRPLRRISRSLASADVTELKSLCGEPTEFGALASLILHSRQTEAQLQKAEEELRHSQKLEAVGRLAGGIAHDFNNLLTAIIGYSQMLEERVRTDAKSLEQVLVIRQAGDQAAALTRQLLAFSRKQLLEPRVLDLNVLLQEIEKLLQRVIGEHIRILVRAGAVDARVLADPTQLEQVILNLGVNARDAMPGGGTLTITTGDFTVQAPVASEGVAGEEMPPGQYVSLTVRDTGSGMDEATRTRIFEPFFTTKGPGRGTGLGLATVYGIVKQSQGHIVVESVIGQGSTFVIHLPWVDLPVASQVAAPAPVEPARGGERILVVEDEEMVRTLVCAVLEEVGYRVDCAASPLEALSIAPGMGHIDVLVTDVVMPGMHGPALAASLLRGQPEMLVLYISGYSENDISDQGLIDPNLEVLSKPFTREALVRKVRSLLEGKAPQAAGAT